MKMRARELKWAAAGFAGGFLFCYCLIGAFQSHPAAAPPLLASAAPAAAWHPVQVVPAVPRSGHELGVTGVPGSVRCEEEENMIVLDAIAQSISRAGEYNQDDQVAAALW
jgi:hypothetical protein